MEPSFGWTTCHIICIDFSVSSSSFPPIKVIIAKHSSNYKKKSIIPIKQQILNRLQNIRPNISINGQGINIKHTDDIFDVSDPDLRACEIGVTDSSNISCAFSPGPVVRLNNPTKENVIQNHSKFKTMRKKRLKGLPMAWEAKQISLADPRLMQFRHWCSNVANLNVKHHNNP